MKLSEKGLQLILDFEVGGGKAYYDRFCSRPTVPGGNDTKSGITIGIGYDCGYQTTGAFVTEWEDFLPQGVIARLLTVVGLRGAEAKRDLKAMRDVAVPWEAALEQFERYTIPRYWAMTKAAFPGVERDGAPQSVKESLLSLVFNRGPSVNGPRRIEMLFIRRHVAGGEWARVPAELREMKRLWPDSKGLRSRREAEALHIEEGLEEG